jgi:hypothetical protein
MFYDNIKKSLTISFLFSILNIIFVLYILNAIYDITKFSEHTL